MKELGIVEEIVAEPEEFTVETLPAVCGDLRRKIQKFMGKYAELDAEELVEKRYRRFRKM